MLEFAGAPTIVYEESWLEHADNPTSNRAEKSTFIRKLKNLLMFMP
jgi:hypothetical protein